MQPVLVQTSVRAPSLVGHKQQVQRGLAFAVLLVGICAMSDQGGDKFRHTLYAGKVH
jgi:hypothetical protein